MTLSELRREKNRLPTFTLSPRIFSLRKELKYTSMNMISAMQMKYLSAGLVGLICLKYSLFMVILLLEPRLITLVNNTRVL